MYLLLLSDSDFGLFGRLIEQAGVNATVVAQRSIRVEMFILYQLRPDPKLWNGAAASLA